MLDRFDKEFFDDNKKYGIVIDFFLLMFPSSIFFQRYNFKEALNDLIHGSGYGDEYLGCCLSTLYDEDEKDEEGYFEDGVLFYECDAKVIIDYPMFVKCMELAYKIYTEEYGEDEEVKRDLQIIKDRYGDK